MGSDPGKTNAHHGKHEHRSGPGQHRGKDAKPSTSDKGASFFTATLADESLMPDAFRERLAVLKKARASSSSHFGSNPGSHLIPDRPSLKDEVDAPSPSGRMATKHRLSK